MTRLGLVIDGAFKCPLCNTMLQRAPEGTYTDGLDSHVRTCHRRLGQPDLLLVETWQVQLDAAWASRPTPPLVPTR